MKIQFPSYFFLVITIIFYSTAYSQEKLEVEGAIIIGGSGDPTPVPGTIRWTGTDFEGWNGVIWVSLTGGASAGSVTDADNNTYKTMKIGNQEWMTKNLRTTKYSNGNPIDLAQSNSGWSSVSLGMSGAYCFFDTTGFGYRNFSPAAFGALYNFYAVDSGLLCPSGWHIPSDEEWQLMITFLGGELIAGGKMKETGLLHWITPNEDASNSSGFTGLPGGSRSTSGDFNTIGYDGTFWTSSAATGTGSYYYYLLWNNGRAWRASLDKGFGFSVRCIKTID